MVAIVSRCILTVYSVLTVTPESDTYPRATRFRHIRHTINNRLDRQKPTCSTVRGVHHTSDNTAHTHTVTNAQHKAKGAHGVSFAASLATAADTARGTLALGAKGNNRMNRKTLESAVRGRQSARTDTTTDVDVVTSTETKTTTVQKRPNGWRI